MKLSKLAALSVLILSLPLFAGAPSMTIEIPAKSFDEASKDAALLIHAHFHDQAKPDTVTAVAEGIVNGRRQSIPLKVAGTSKPDVYAVKAQWPMSGTWVVAVTIEEHAAIGALVKLGPNGSYTQGASVKKLDRKIAASDIESLLQRTTN